MPPAPQLMPAPVTFPPVGTGEMVSVYGGPVGKPPPVAVNVALHVFAASTSTLVVALVPLHAPPQLVNVYPVAAAAVSVAVVAPPTPFGAENPNVLAVCRELGVREVYRVGGAQGVAAQ